MTTRDTAQGRDTFDTFGGFLRLLRRRARLTQRELAVAVNYSEGQICHLEAGRRQPDLATLAALFVPALGLEDAPQDAARLLALAGAPRPAPRDRPRANGPATPTVGRERLRAELRALLTDGDARLVTLVGPPGVGKTHMALQLAHDLRDTFPGAAHLVDLTAVDDPALVAPAIARELELGEDPLVDPAEQLADALRGRSGLLVLDNVEQVAEAAPLLARLAAEAPGLRLLLTSRVALRLRAERVVEVRPLAVPDLSRLPAPAELAQVESVALLLARLRAVAPEIELTGANALALAAICVRVDGLPLAIELVASRGAVLGPQELLSEVTQRFQTLRQRGRDVPARHRTLAAALQWSAEQLSPGARALLARLSVFAGHWRAALAAAVCDLEGDGRAALLDRLEELVGHSLVQRHVRDEETRLGMLAMVREHAADLLDVRGEADQIHRRLLVACAELAEQAEGELTLGAEQARWMALMDAEHDTLRAALGWAIEAGAHAEGVRLAAALWRFWYMRGMLREGRGWLERFLALPPAGRPATRAHALDGAAILAWRQGDYGQAEVWLREALRIYRAERHQAGEARVLSHMGMIEAERGAVEPALEHYGASLQISRALGDGAAAAAVLHNLGNLHCHQNRHEEALALYAECLAAYERQGSLSDIALVSLGIGASARDLGQHEEARAAFGRSLAIARELGDEWTAGTALLNLGDSAMDGGDAPAGRAYYAEALATSERLGDQQQIAVIQGRMAAAEALAGDSAAAVRLFRQSLMLASAIGYQPSVADALEGLAGCAGRAQPLLAARLFAAAGALRTAIGLPISLAEAPRYEESLRQAQRAADPAAWAVAWDEGRALTPAQAVALALTRA